MVSFSTSVVNKFSIKDVWHYLLSNIDIKVKCEVENKKKKNILEDSRARRKSVSEYDSNYAKVVSPSQPL